MAETKKRGPGRPPGSKNKNKNTSTGSRSTRSEYSGKSKEEHIEELRLKYERDKRTIDVIWSITFIAVGIFLAFAVIGDSAGAVGSTIHNISLGLFGVMGYVLPFLIILGGLLLIMRKLQHVNARTSICGALMFLQMCLLNSYRFIEESKLAFGFEDIVKYYKFGVEGEKGGAIGMEIGSIIVKLMGKPGLLIMAIAVLVACIFLVADTPISKFLHDWRVKREEKRMLAELDAAEQAKVQQAVALTSQPVPNRYIEDDTDFVPVIKSNPADLQDTIVMPTQADQHKEEGGFFSKFRKNTLFSNPEPNPEAGKYDQEEVGASAAEAIMPQMEQKSVSYGLGGDTTKPSGCGLGLDDGYSTGMQGGYGLGAEPVKPVRVINSGASAATKAAESAVPGAVSNLNKNVPVRNGLKGASDAETDKMGEELSAALSTNNDDSNYEMPSFGLLKKGSGGKQQMTDIQLEQRADLLEQTLRDFGVEATVLEVTQGASVTRYEVQPATGVKVSSITKLADDIALNLRAKSIRIEAPIPGKAAVGIEVENDKPAPVVVRDLIESEEFINAKSKISFVVGKDISGHNIIADLKSMPHLLIAGATGSGKSVCINTIIASFLYKAKPSEVKLIMIDPKVVELQSYNGIPHMLVPVVTDPRKASKALAIAVQEMDKRYEAFAKYGVKDLDSYNEYMRAEHEYGNVKPQIVIIIDELADLMMACSNEVETSICRLAQKARAAGMHLIVATQRPSVDVVTGLIKANIPSRIAFSVSSSTDSRTILDMGGAEKLLGKGDMLFSPVGSNKPYRVQGPFITEGETAKLIKFVKQQGGDAQYDKTVQDAIESDGKSAGGNGEMQDELTEDAIAFILKSKQASVSMLQRRFRIGYNRAARIIDEIEEQGIIGPSDGARPRQVLFTEDEYYGGGEEQVAEVVEEAVDDAARLEPAYEPVETIDVEPEVVRNVSSDTGVHAFSSLPESVQKELLNSDD